MAKEYRFEIDAFTPETMPMGRLAEYLGRLAQMLGERRAVHFVSLEPGSTVVVHKIEDDAVPKVRARTASVKRGQAPADVITAYRGINKMLREDNGVGRLKESTGAEIIRFPGREEEDTRIKGVSQRGAIDGEVIRVGGVDKHIVPIMLSVEGLTMAGCWARRTVAKALAPHLFEPVRLFGKGRWERSEDGIWVLDHFTVEAFEPLNDEPLSGLLATLREVGGDWGEGALEELQAIRHGFPEKSNGGS
jgi:hypothetical protein